MVTCVEWYDVKLKPSRRVTRCRNCFDPDDLSPIQPGKPRIVVTKGMGTGTRNLTLCLSCAEWEASRMEAFALEIRAQISRVGVA